MDEIAIDEFSARVDELLDILNQTGLAVLARRSVLRGTTQSPALL
jgi:hypothetical protein